MFLSIKYFSYRIFIHKKKKIKTISHLKYLQILTVLLDAIFGEENNNTLRSTPYQLVKIYNSSNW